MKLLTIANRYYLITLFIVFIVGSLVAYFVLKSIINKEFNQKLLAEKEQLIYELHTYEDLKENYYLNIGDRIEVDEVSDDPNIRGVLRDTTMYDPYEKKVLPFRQLTFSDQFNDRYYIITITKSLLPNQDLVEGISEIMLGIISLLLLSIGFVNRVIFKKLWSPFYHLTDQLKTFNITRPKPISMKNTRVEEFGQLKSVLDTMISKSIKDYKTLKEYTENTSHEIQTPLAVIKNKAEILLQEPLSESQLTEVGRIYEAAGRLSRLKEGLSILSKIENNQFLEAVTINVRAFIEDRLHQLGELIEIRHLKLTTVYGKEPVLLLNDDLAYILFNNLLSNAIKHNINNGEIVIRLDNHSLTIENTGKAPSLPTEELFDRFKRSGNLADSTGLGLSLVRGIADFYKLKISYTYNEPLHKVVLSF